MAIANSANKYSVSRWIVDATPGQGTHTTIAGALTSASSGDAIFIRPGTYTENVTLKAGVNLTGFLGDSLTPEVTIIGKLSASFAGTCSISNIRLQTNADFVLDVSGASATVIYINDCYLNLTNNTGISFTSSSSSSSITVSGGGGNIGAVGIAIYSNTSSGTLTFNENSFGNTGNSSTANTSSAGLIQMRNTGFANPITTSGTCMIAMSYAVILTSGTNSTSLTVDGAGVSTVTHSRFASGTASAISIGASATLGLHFCFIASSNTNAITGAGTLQYSTLSFGDVSSNINTTTQTKLNAGPSATFGSSNSGNTNSITVENTSNTASSSASLIARVAGGTAADPVFQSVITGGTSWTWGADNSDSDAYVLAQGTALGTNNVMRATSAGEITYPLQPAFLATHTVDQLNITGNGTLATINFTNEIVDRNNDYNGSNIFTAPVTGVYQFTASVSLSSVTGATNGIIGIQTSNRSYSSVSLNYNAIASSASATLNLTVLADLDAADLASVFVVLTGIGADTADAVNSPTTTFFSGHLVC